MKKYELKSEEKIDWKKYPLTRDVQAYQEYCRLRNQVRRLTRKAQQI